MTGMVFRMPANVESVREATNILESFPEKFPVRYAPWINFPYKPEVDVICSWQPLGLYLKFHVKEDCVRAVYSHPNEPVYKDSCVEFFVSPPGARGYYNFEFNAIGNILAAYGTSRNDRKFLPEETIRKIGVLPSLGREPFQERIGETRWDLTVFIPAIVFGEHVSVFDRNTILHANFYKCGDELSKPHYLCWSEIHTTTPDFHRPEYFGELILAE